MEEKKQTSFFNMSFPDINHYLRFNFSGEYINKRLFDLSLFFFISIEFIQISNAMSLNKDVSDNQERSLIFFLRTLFIFDTIDIICTALIFILYVKEIIYYSIGDVTIGMSNSLEMYEYTKIWLWTILLTQIIFFCLFNIEEIPLLFRTFSYLKTVFMIFGFAFTLNKWRINMEFIFFFIWYVNTMVFTAIFIFISFTDFNINSYCDMFYGVILIIFGSRDIINFYNSTNSETQFSYYLKRFIIPILALLPSIYKIFLFYYYENQKVLFNNCLVFLILELSVLFILFLINLIIKLIREKITINQALINRVLINSSNQLLLNNEELPNGDDLEQF